jgi:HAMP domain-containing protein
MFFIPSWAIGIAVIMIALQVSRVISGRSSRRPPLGNDAELGDLRQSLDAMQGRVSELEERVDFTERLLATQREADRLKS